MTPKEQFNISNDPHSIIEEIVSARLNECNIRHRSINFKFERNLFTQLKLVLMGCVRAKRCGELLIVREYTNRLLLLLLVFPFFTRNARFVINHNISTGCSSFLLHLIASYLGYRFFLIDGKPLIPFFSSVGLKILNLESSKPITSLDCHGKSALILGVKPERVNECGYLLSDLGLGSLVFAGRSDHEMILETREDYLHALVSSEVICFLPPVFSYSARNSGTLWDAIKLNKWIITWDLPVFREQLKCYTNKVFISADEEWRGCDK